MDHSGANVFSTGSQRCTLNMFYLKTRSLMSATSKMLRLRIPISKIALLNPPSFITQVRTWAEWGDGDKGGLVVSKNQSAQS